MRSMKTIDLVKETRALLKKGWTKGANARNVGRKEVTYSSPDAVSFCVNGAMHRATKGNFTLYTRVHNALTSANPNVPNLSWNLIGYNDSSRNKDRVVKVV